MKECVVNIPTWFFIGRYIIILQKLERQLSLC